jgi:predicted metal-binding membrane protein
VAEGAVRATPARRGFFSLAGALILFAWAALWLLGSSPYGRYLDHGSWLGPGSPLAWCRALPGEGAAVLLLLYLGGWLLMTAAMMLPTIAPLLNRFDRVVSGRGDRNRLMALVIGGYLVVWTGFGVAAHLFDMALERAARHSEWMLLNGWAIAAAIFVTAGLFQFSALKYRCLAKCRTPLSFIAKHWHGPKPLRNALMLGLDHGVFCVGCCWAIMLLMFVVGSANFGWMLALGLIMAIEKNMSWGARLGRPLGGALLAGAAVIAAVNLAP